MPAKRSSKKHSCLTQAQVNRGDAWQGGSRRLSLFPEPDLVHVQISDEWVKEIRPTLPELPAARRKRFITDYGISVENAEFLDNHPTNR